MNAWGSVILWLSMIWLPPLLGLFLRNEAKPKKNIIVGTTLPHEAQGDPAVLALTARYKRELKWVCLALMLPAIPGVFIRDFGLNMLLWMIWILVICVAVNIPYVRCNRALRRLKADRGWRREPSAQTGTFRSEDWGTFTCCVDPRQGPWLLIETVDGRLFLFNATDPAATEAALAVIGSTSFS